MGAEEHDLAEVEQESPLIASLRAAREKARAKKHLDLPVPGYPDDVLAIRYKALPREDWIKMAENDDSGDSDLAGLVDSCEAILIKNGSGEYEPLLDAETDQPVRFDVRLSRFLEIDAEDAQEVVAAVFNLDVFPLAVTNHIKAIIRWSQGLSVRENQDLLGELTA